MTANQIAYQKMREEGRANLAREIETKRANMSQEAIKRSELSENSRHNLAVEGETARANQAREAETNRSNLAKELETNRANLAREAETHRSNVESESIARQNVGLGYANVGLGYSNLAEATRSHQASEQINQYKNELQSQVNTESHRSNVAKEEITRWQTRYAESNANLRKKAELKVQQEAQSGNILSRLAGTIAQLIK